MTRNVRNHRLVRGATSVALIRNIVIGVILIVVGGFLYKGETFTIDFIEFNPGVTIGAIGVLLILWPVIDSFYVQTLRKVIEGRNQALENTFAEAEQLRTEMQKMKSDYESRLEETEARAREQIQQQIREAQDLRASLETDARKRADDMVKKATDDIAAERDRVLTQIRVDVASLAFAATEKLLQENIDDARNRKLIEDFLNSREVGSR